MFSDDITFCIADCDYLQCTRNKKHIRRPDMPHSYADFTGLSECEKKENKNAEE